MYQMNKTLPVVFSWKYMGRDLKLAGDFTNW